MLGDPNPKGEPMGQNRQRDGLLAKIDKLIDDAECFDTVRNIRWSKGIRCLTCRSIVAGHKGYPEDVKKARKGRRNRLKGARGRGTLEKEKPPVLGIIQPTKVPLRPRSDAVTEPLPPWPGIRRKAPGWLVSSAAGPEWGRSFSRGAGFPRFHRGSFPGRTVQPP